MGPAGAFCPSISRAIFAGVCAVALTLVAVDADRAFVAVDEASDVGPFLDYTTKWSVIPSSVHVL